MTHMIFAPTGTLKLRTPAYQAIHADLVRTYLKVADGRQTKRQRAILKNKIFKQTGEIHG